MTHHRPLRAAAALGLAASLVLAGCGGDATTGSGSPSSAGTSSATSAAEGEHNQADEMFSAMMVPHHEQAIEMADLVPERSDDQELKDLAQQIKDAQGPEIETMEGWLDDWGAKPGSMMDHSGHGMGGMMSEEDMTELKSLSGKPFDTKWLEMMIEHHEGAIDMAEMVKRNGESAEVEALADDIITAQRREIDQMQGMLKG